MPSRSAQPRLGPPAIRSGNRAGVLEVIRRNQGISRAELTRHTGLTQAAISNIVGDLLEQGLVIEDGHTSADLGRPRIRLAINAGRYAVIGIDLARSQIQAIVTDLHGNILHALAAASTFDHPLDITLGTLTGLIEQLLAECGDLRSRIVGIGIGAPGPLSASEGAILSPPNFSGWRNVPIRRILQEHFGLPVFIDNDANACALAEGWFGAGQAYRNFVYFAVGTGVGAGLMVDGAIYRGAHDIAGEIGHTTVEATGPRCTCGNVGCLEMYTSALALVHAARFALMQGEPSLIAELAGGNYENIGVDKIAAAARRHDPLAERLMRQEVQYLGAAIVNLVNLMDPEAVFLGREVAQVAGDLLLDPLRQLVAQRAFSVAAERVELLPATLGQDAPALGAACLVLQELFQRPERVLSAERVPMR